MTHPLTDDIIEEISVSYLTNCEGVKSNMRAAYDLAIEHVENVIELKLEALSGEWRPDLFDTSIAIEDFGKELIKTIRPQKDN